MKLSKEQVGKLDPELQKALEEANGYESIRAIMVLDPKPSLGLVPLRPSDFSDRTAYRKALILSQEQQVSQQLDYAKQALAGHCLDVKGGRFSPAVVVEGTVGDIVSSLNLPEVKYARLDKAISLPD
jgi:hypothetical protein